MVDKENEQYELMDEDEPDDDEIEGLGSPSTFRTLSQAAGKMPIPSASHPQAPTQQPPQSKVSRTGKVQELITT